MHSSTSAALVMRRSRCCCSKKLWTAWACVSSTGGGAELALPSAECRNRWLTKLTATPCRDRKSPAGDAKHGRGGGSARRRGTAGGTLDIRRVGWG